MWWLEFLYVLFFAANWYPCCCNQTTTECCAACIDDISPIEIEAVIANVVDGTCNCDAINGTWVLMNDCSDPLNVCRWTYSLTAGELATMEVSSSGVCITPDTGTLTLDVLTTQILLEVRVTHVFPQTGIWTITFRNNYSPAQDHDCVFSGFSVTRVGGSGALNCNHASATCSLTAVT